MGSRARGRPKGRLSDTVKLWVAKFVHEKSTTRATRRRNIGKAKTNTLDLDAVGFKRLTMLTIEQLKETKDDENPQLIFDKYRIRFMNINDCPIVNNLESLTRIGLSTNDLIIIDKPSLKKDDEDDLEQIKKNINTDGMEQDNYMEDNKENIDGAPLKTSFMTMESLKAETNASDESIIVSTTRDVTLFDCNPLDISEAMQLQIRLQSTKIVDDDAIPLFIASTSSRLPSIELLWFGKTKKSNKFSGITRVLGNVTNETEEQINGLSCALHGRHSTSRHQYKSIYDIISRSTNEKNKDPGEVSIKMSWSSVNQLKLLSEPMNMTNCDINIDLGWKDHRFFDNPFLFKQLFFVMNLADVLTNPENDVIFDPTNKKTIDELTTDMNNLIEKYSNGDIVFAIKGSGEEVTEQLWLLLLNCTEFKQVSLLLKSFLQSLGYGKLKAQVRKDNKSMLAELIRTSKKGDFRLPRLERLNTIEMLMEIGVEYLRREILDHFIKTYNFSSEEVEIILTDCEKQLQTTHGAAESRAISLLPIALAAAALYQLSQLLAENTNTIMPEMIRRMLSKFTNVLLNQCKNVKSEVKYSFDISLPLSRLNQSILKNNCPRVWMCETTKSHGVNVSARLVTCLQREMPLKHVNRMMNVVRPSEDRAEEGDKVENRKEEYTVSHTIIAYYQ